MPGLASLAVADRTVRVLGHLGVGCAISSGLWCSQVPVFVVTQSQPMSAMPPKATICCAAAK